MPEKRLHEEATENSEEEEESRKKPKIAEGTTITESILDDICIDEIESRIVVHSLDTAEACTHEVAVYPGECRWIFSLPGTSILFFVRF